LLQTEPKIMRVRAGGFTEAEALALAWSKRNKEADLIEAKRPVRVTVNREDIDNYKRPRFSSSRSHREERRPHRRSPEPSKSKRTGERDSPNYNPYVGNSDNYTDTTSCNDSRGRDVRDNGTGRVQHDEWDRSRSRDRTVRHRSKESRRKGVNDRSGRNRSPLSRSRSRSRSRTRSRSRSIRRSPITRSRSRSPLPPTWAHDKFSAVAADSPNIERRRERDGDYRPPSPTWVSRAGGVAIMRKKSKH
jgi:hypothetical protein